MTSARERAVEAGARALCAGNGTPWNLCHHRARGNYRALSRAALRAAFPILAEELVKVAEDAGNSGMIAADNATDVIVEALRARIQQMAEAEHE